MSANDPKRTLEGYVAGETSRRTSQPSFCMHRHSWHARTMMRERFTQTEPTECVQRSLASLREVSAIVDTKAPDEAAAFKTWLREISQKVAEAAVEGSFLGFGGVRVSDAETATLRDISKALGTAS